MKVRNKPGAAVLSEMAARFAHEPRRERDEDNLDREDCDAEAVLHIIKAMRSKGPVAVRAVRLFAESLERLANAYMERDDQELEEAASDACEALVDLRIGEKD
jgi:ERCC4-type nuclease